MQTALYEAYINERFSFRVPERHKTAIISLIDRSLRNAIKPLSFSVKFILDIKKILQYKKVIRII